MATRVQICSVSLALVVAAVLAVHGEPLNDLRTRNVGYAPEVFTRVSNSESGSFAGATRESFKAAEFKPAVSDRKYPHTDSFDPVPEEYSQNVGSRFSDGRPSLVVPDGEHAAVPRGWFPDDDLYYPPAVKFARNFAGSSFPDAGDNFGSKPYYPHNDLNDPPADFAQSFEDSSSGRRYHGKYPHNDLYNNGRSSVSDQPVNSFANSRPFGDVYTYDATRASSGAAASFSSSTRFDGKDATYDDATDLADDDDSPASSGNSTTSASSSPSDGSVDG